MDDDLVHDDLLGPQLLPKDLRELTGVVVSIKRLAPEVLVRDLREVDGVDLALSERLLDVLVQEHPNGLLCRPERGRDDLEQDGSIVELFA
jgi:hypothetical protein